MSDLKKLSRRALNLYATDPVRNAATTAAALDAINAGDGQVSHREKAILLRLKISELANVDDVRNRTYAQAQGALDGLTGGAAKDQPGYLKLSEDGSFLNVCVRDTQGKPVYLAVNRGRLTKSEVAANKKKTEFYKAIKVCETNEQPNARAFASNAWEAGDQLTISLAAIAAQLQYFYSSAAVGIRTRLKSASAETRKSESGVSQMGAKHAVNQRKLTSAAANFALALHRPAQEISTGTASALGVKARRKHKLSK